MDASKIPKHGDNFVGGGLGCFVSGTIPVNQRGRVDRNAQALKEVSQNIGVKQAGQRVDDLVKVAWTETVKEAFLRATEEQVQTLDRRSALLQSHQPSLATV